MTTEHMDLRAQDNWQRIVERGSDDPDIRAAIDTLNAGSRTEAEDLRDQLNDANARNNRLVAENHALRDRADKAERRCGAMLITMEHLKDRIRELEVEDVE